MSAKKVVTNAFKKLDPSKAISAAKDVNYNKKMMGKMSDWAEKTVSGKSGVTNPAEHIRMATQGHSQYKDGLNASKKVFKSEAKSLGKAYGTAAAGAAAGTVAVKGVNNTVKKEKTAYDIVNESFEKIANSLTDI